MPAMKPDDVLVKIHAAAVNPIDWKVRESMLTDKLAHELPLILGWGFAGEIAAVGDRVTRWSVGDAVYGRPDITRNGSYSEYIAVNAAEIARKPESLTRAKVAACERHAASIQ